LGANPTERVAKSQDLNASYTLATLSPKNPLPLFSVIMQKKQYMEATFEDIPLINNELSRQFEMVADNVKAKIEYDLQKDRMFLVHTEVPPALAGKGAGNAIVEKTLHYLEENNLKLVPLCPFVAAYVKKHPEWKRLLAQGISL
jgi:hypothetical protein